MLNSSAAQAVCCSLQTQVTQFQKLPVLSPKRELGKDQSWEAQ